MLDINSNIKLALNGDKRGEDRIYTLIDPLVKSNSWKYFRGSNQYEDHCQECRVKVFKVLDKFNGETDSEFRAWTSKILRNQCIDILRKQKMTYVEFEPNISERCTKPDYTTYDSEYFNEVINSLPKEQRKIFKMYVIDGYLHKEIATKLGIEINTSKTTVFRARKNLMKILKEYNNNN